MVRVPGPGVTTMTIPMPSNVKPNTNFKISLGLLNCPYHPIHPKPEVPKPTALLEAHRASCPLDAAIRENDSKSLSTSGTNCVTRLPDKHAVPDNGLRQVRHSKGFGQLQKSEIFCTGG